MNKIFYVRQSPTLAHPRRVNWNKMMWMMKNIGIDWRDRNLIAKLYLGQKAAIKINNELPGCCEIRQKSTTRLSTISSTV